MWRARRATRVERANESVSVKLDETKVKQRKLRTLFELPV